MYDGEEGGYDRAKRCWGVDGVDKVDKVDGVKRDCGEAFKEILRWL
jgi:hypothetical protein